MTIRIRDMKTGRFISEPTDAERDGLSVVFAGRSDWAPITPKPWYRRLNDWLRGTG